MNYAIFFLCLNWGALLHLHFYVNIKFTIPEASGGFVSDLTLICFSKKATKTRCHFFLVLSVSSIRHIRSTHLEGVLNVNQRGSMRIILIRFGAQNTIGSCVAACGNGHGPVGGCFNWQDTFCPECDRCVLTDKCWEVFLDTFCFVIK